jgi:hypothetical protein
LLCLNQRVWFGQPALGDRWRDCIVLDCCWGSLLGKPGQVWGASWELELSQRAGVRELERKVF